MLDGEDVVDDLLRVIDRTNTRRIFALVNQEILERGDGSFDLRGKDRLLPHVHVDQEVRIWQERRKAIQTTERQVGSVDQVVVFGG